VSEFRSDKSNYCSKWQSPIWTSHFVKHGDRVSLGQATRVYWK